MRAYLEEEICNFCDCFGCRVFFEDIKDSPNPKCIKAHHLKTQPMILDGSEPSGNNEVVVFNLSMSPETGTVVPYQHGNSAHISDPLMMQQSPFVSLHPTFSEHPTLFAPNFLDILQPLSNFFDHYIHPRVNSAC